jgi:hypothetical protein
MPQDHYPPAAEAARDYFSRGIPWNFPLEYGTFCQSLDFLLEPGYIERFYVEHTVLFRTSRWRPHVEDKRMVLEYTHGLFIT